MNKASAVWGLPESLHVKKISFVSIWNRDLLNLTSLYENGKRYFLFGYFWDSSEAGEVSRACAVIEETDEFSLETRSMFWRIAEINVERQNEWLIFSRHQHDFSTQALTDFLVNSKIFLEHLRDEHKRLNPE